MRYFGIILIGVGIALFIFVVMTMMEDRNRIISPVPPREGGRIIITTPGK